MLSKIIYFVKKYREDIILSIGVILISLLSFAAGYIVAKQQEKTPIQFEMINEQTLVSAKISNFKF